MNIPDTGERILLEKETPLMISRHLSAYSFAKNYVHDKRVLDIGCGQGYGTYFLAEFCKEALGTDYDAAIIDYAKNRYKRGNLKFEVLDIKDLDLFKGKLDIVCCFQVIEHIRDARIFLENINNLLNPDGVFICSTPNKLDASPHSDMPHNKFHVKEYLLDEFRQLLSGFFKEIDMFGLKRSKKLCFYRRLKKMGLFNFLPDNIDPVKRFYAKISCADFVIIKDNIDNALDFIAVCKKGR